MALFEWKNEYSVSIQKIDDQHKRLLGYLDELFEAMKQGKGKEALSKVLNGMVAYTKEHFFAEENLMKLYNYPGFEAHKKEHEKLTAEVVRLKEQFDSGQVSSPVKISNFLKEWLMSHIIRVDKAYAPFLNEKGVR